MHAMANCVWAANLISTTAKPTSKLTCATQVEKVVATVVVAAAAVMVTVLGALPIHAPILSVINFAMLA
jgi:hypothetical protein